MGRSCCVPHCGVLGTKPFFTFPGKPEMKKLWLAAINDKRVTALADPRICSRHFKVEDLILPNSENEFKRVRAGLKEGVVPTVDLKPDPYKRRYKYASCNPATNKRAQRYASRKAKEQEAESASGSLGPTETFLRSLEVDTIPGIKMEVEDSERGEKGVQADLTGGSLEKMSEWKRKIVKLSELVRILTNDKRTLKENNETLEIQVASLSNQKTMLEQRAQALFEKVRILEDKVNLLEANGERNTEEDSTDKVDKAEAPKAKDSESDVKIEPFTSWTLCGTEETVHLPPEVLKQLSGITTITSEDINDI